jgi:hypothetical protein
MALLAAAGLCAPLPPKPTPSPKPPDTPVCSISLYERPVQVPGVSLIADHTYILLSDGSGQTTIEGGPDLISAPVGYLIGFTSNPPGGPGALNDTNPSAPDNKQVGRASSAPNTCAAIQTIERAESKYNSSGTWAAYDPTAIFGYNSNSFTYTLLNDVGLTKAFGPLLGLGPGWGQVVPGLQ